MSQNHGDLCDIFSAALDCPTAQEQAVYLDEACRNQPDLRARIEKLLRAHSAAGPFLGEPAGGPNVTVDTAPERPGLNRVAGDSPARPAPVVREGFVQLSMAELRSLLRRRLIIITLMMFVSGCVLHGVRWTRYYRDQTGGGFPPTGWHHWLAIGAEAGAVALAGVLLALLKLRPGLTLRALRVVELLICAAIVGDLLTDLSIFQTITAPNWWEQGQDVAVVRLLLRQTPQAFVLEWFILLVGYGMLIPNTGRRCAAVVGAMVLCAALASVVLFLVAAPQQRAFQLDFFAKFGTWLGIGAGVAIFGSHRLESLRREAIEARQLGQYQLKRPLGAGGMGEVYLAEHRLLKRPCAVKLIRPDRAGDPQILRRFEREVQATTQLNHPHVVQIFDYGYTDDGAFYYAMEYLPGLSLEEIVRDHGPLPAGRVVNLLRQMCSALSEAHRLGLIHRDLKPSNIMVCRFGRRSDVAKLLDFGLVQNVTPGDPITKLTQFGSILGTPDFMSPEQVRGDIALDGRSDLYSLGATAYYLLTGQPPFAGKNPMQTLVAHLNAPVRPPSELRGDVPQDLQAIVLRTLSKAPAERFPDADSLLAAVAGCACANAWTEEQANAWWDNNSKTHD